MAWLQSVPFIVMHFVPLLAIFTGVGVFEVGLCVALYLIRMFFITAGYHRYFSHRTFRTSRVMQFVIAFIAMTSAQKGVLWWAAHHRHHHRYSDQPEDTHSPKHGFWWSHMVWFLTYKNGETRLDLVPDFKRYPELMWLDRFYQVPPILLGAFVFFTWGASALFIGFFLSTVILFHGTFTVNSLAHVFGRRRFATSDTSRNSFLIALWTLGEGWHNNHHHFPGTVRQGFRWWELDVTWYVLWLMSKVGLVWDLRAPPRKLLTA